MTGVARQLTLDWFGGALDHVPLPPTGDVSSEVLRAVLIAVYRLPESAGGKRGHPCWAGQGKIAAWATEWLERQGRKGKSVSERTARRALAVLQDQLELLTSIRAPRPECRTRQTLDHYVIDWTRVASELDQARRVTRQPATRPAPATRPGDESGTASGPMEGFWPVDRPDWPVDRPDWPVDRPDWPVDPAEDSISARVPDGLIPDQEILSTAAALVRSDPDGAREADGRTDRAAAVEFLREVGVTTAAQRVDELAGRGIAYQAILAECRRLWAIASGQAAKFRSGPACGLAYRLRTGDWPCAVDEDLQAVETRAATKRSEADGVRWQRVLDQAWRSVRGRTPAGELVDDRAVMDEAVRLGVPAAVAARERGVLAR